MAAFKVSSGKFVGRFFPQEIAAFEKSTMLRSMFGDPLILSMTVMLFHFHINCREGRGGEDFVQ